MSANKPMSVEEAVEKLDWFKSRRMNQEDEEDYIAAKNNLIAAVRAECADEYLVNELDMKGATSRLIAKAKADERALVLAKFRELADEWIESQDDQDWPYARSLFDLIQSLETPNQKP